VGRVRVANADDPYGRRLAEEFDGVWTIGIDFADADFRAVEVASGVAGSAFTAVTPAGPVDVRLPLPGRFNVLNALGAIAVASGLGVEVEAAARALAGAGRVPGRFEPVDEGQPFAVIVDYAHKPDALENVLRTARELADGRLICVFGCGGDRDRGKRPLMGSVVRRLADVGLVTSDNPRSEDPAAIIADITAGFDMDVEVDRRTAIARAVATAEPDDVVVIAGKGHEQGQELADRTIPFDDREVAREALTALAGAA